MSREPWMAERSSVAFLEEGAFIAPKFDRDGLIPVVTTDAQSGDVLMLGFMNPEALRRSIETREAHYWSRSRGALWRKGATSGLVQRIVEMRIDDDQDAIWLTRQRRRARRELPCRVSLLLFSFRHDGRARRDAGFALLCRDRKGLRSTTYLRRRAQSDDALIGRRPSDS